MLVGRLADVGGNDAQRKPVHLMILHRHKNLAALHNGSDAGSGFDTGAACACY